MILTGNTPPFHITQPSTDNYVQIVSPTATMATLTCSLNVTSLNKIAVQWTRIRGKKWLNSVDRTGNTTTTTIVIHQPLDTDVYQCLFSDTSGSNWAAARHIKLRIPSMFVDTRSKI